MFLISNEKDYNIIDINSKKKVYKNDYIDGQKRLCYT